MEEVVERLSRHHGPRLNCRIGCCQCCVDELTVFEVEALHIRQRFAELLEAGEPHAEGACAFLGSGGDCRIYEARPYVCRTQGLPLRWIEEVSEEEIVEMRDICPLNEPGPPVEEIPEDLCWSIGPVEERLAKLQASIDGGCLRRVLLRSLFRKAARTESPDSVLGS
ncbi:MAG: YkgJ family cysteine cluster protein [Syntrophobacteraceae bacterium]|nr:YkgJ family cysteine cluster protein [Syntrophobacteraceae bacterium]